MQSIRGFSVPQLIDFNEDLQIIEMTIVRKPFLLDFAKSYLDTEPDFSNDRWEEWERSGIELFGELRWKEARISRRFIEIAWHLLLRRSPVESYVFRLKIPSPARSGLTQRGLFLPR